jgi:hypothetical protein
MLRVTFYLSRFVVVLLLIAFSSSLSLAEIIDVEGEKACLVQSERMVAIIRAGKNVKRNQQEQAKSCLALMEKNQQLRVGDMIDKYEELIRGASALPTYNGPKTFLESCEEALKLLLKVPSSYTLISAVEAQPKPLSVQEYTAGHLDRSRYEALAGEHGGAPVRLTADVSYIAGNAMGGTLRYKSQCIYDAPIASEVPGPYAVRVDGRTHIQRMFYNQQASR